MAIAESHLGRAVDSRQTKQATQVDAGLHRLAFQAEVELACLGTQGIKRLFQRGAPRPPAHGQRCQAVIRQHDQLPSLVAADMLGHHLALVQDADFMTVGANRDRLAHQVRRHRVAVRVELDPRMTD